MTYSCANCAGCSPEPLTSEWPSIGPVCELCARIDTDAHLDEPAWLNGVTMIKASEEKYVPSFQGDLGLMRVDGVPNGLKAEPMPRGYVAAHSETGHHHTVEILGKLEATLYRTQDPFVCYLRLDGEGEAHVVHQRSFDTHETQILTAGIWMLGNQQEYTPEGLRRAAD